MALDNVWDEGDSIRIAKKLMGGSFHKGSVIMVTSRSLKTLESLNLNGKACFEVPELEKVDATSLFKYHAFPKKESFSQVEMEHVSSCVERCNFEKGNGRTHYHPLALEALGILTSTLSLENLSPEEWGAKLRSVMDFDHLSEGNGVFDILRTSFDKLSQDDQNLFMDVAYLKSDEFYGERWDKKWLCCVHEKNEVELQAQLDILKRRGLLQHIEQTSGEVEIHDLYIEFAQKELSGTFNKADLCENQKWMEIENVCNPIMKRDRNWSKLTRLHVEDDDESHDLEILTNLDLQYFSRVEVLTLNLTGVTLGTLNLEPMKCLRSINMVSELRCFHEVKGMEKLKQLYHFSWFVVESCNYLKTTRRDCRTLTTIGQFPPSLTILQVDDGLVSICSSAVNKCTRLEDISLGCISPTMIDLSKNSSLQKLIMTREENLYKYFPKHFHRIRGFDHLVLLKTLELRSCKVDGHLKLDLRHVRGLQEFSSCDCRYQILYLPQRIQCLRLSQGRDRMEDFVGILKTNALRDLEVLELKFRRDFEGSTNFKDVGSWPRLQELKLLGCNISKLPDLSESTCLKTLIVGEELWMCDLWMGCDYEFQFGEDEVAMLARLPRLQPVCVGFASNQSSEECNFTEHKRVEPKPQCRCIYTVDFSRRMLMKRELDMYRKPALERELGVAPYKLHTFKQNWENATEIKYWLHKE